VKDRVKNNMKKQSASRSVKKPFLLSDLSKSDPATIYNRIKVRSDEKFRKSGQEEMARFLERQFQAERRHLAERDRRVGPVYNELRAAVRQSPELKRVVRAIDSLKRQPWPERLPAAERQPFAPKKPMVRAGSIHIVDSLPFFPSVPWVWQDGTSNQITGPTADGNTGDMSFEMSPGQSSSGHMACMTALGVTLEVPNQPCIIQFTASPSYNWSYFEFSDWWRETKGNMWIGQYVGVFNQAGTFLNNPINTQLSVASFDDNNLSDAGQDSGSNSAFPLESSLFVGAFPFFGDPEAQGGVIQYWCWIGGSCNADGSNAQSGCNLQMNANCSSLVIDIFDF